MYATLLFVCFLSIAVNNLKAQAVLLPDDTPILERAVNETALSLADADDASITPWPWGVVPIPGLSHANLEFRLYGLGEKAGYLGALVHCLDSGISYIRPYATRGARIPVNPQSCITDGLDLYMYPTTNQQGSGTLVLAAMLYFRKLVRQWEKVKTSAVVVTGEGHSVPDLVIMIFVAT